MMALDDAELFSLPLTFMGVPYGRPGSDSRAAIIGLPFDCGTHPFRVGARGGPDAVRWQSPLIRRFNPTHADFDPLTALGVVDCGNVRLVPGRIRDAFARYTTATYANRFDDYGGERFEVEPTTAANPNGVIVQSRIVKSNDEKVSLDYLMRRGPDGNWKIIDVYLSGTVSELASRRSEFGAVLQRDGADGLVHLLEQRAAPQHPG